MADLKNNDSSETVPTNPQAMFAAKQNADIQYMRDNGNENGALRNEIIRDIEGKTMFRDADTGAKVTIIDGDLESIKSYLESSHKAILESDGGVDGLVERMTDKFQEQVADGSMTQAAMDKQIEILSEAGADSEKYAQLRFDNNGFFAEQATVAGENPDRVNDAIIITSFREIVTVSDPSQDGSSEPVEAKVTDTSSNLTHENLDERTLIKVADGNELTNTGQLFVMADVMASLTGGIGGVDTVDVFKTQFDKMLAEQGSIEAMVVHLEHNMDEFTGSGDVSPEKRAEIISAVKNSEGNSALFVASMLNGMNELPVNPVVDPAADHVERERRATDTQNLLGLKGMNGNEGIIQLFSLLMAIFTGKDLKEVMAKMKTQNSANDAGKSEVSPDVTPNNKVVEQDTVEGKPVQVSSNANKTGSPNTEEQPSVSKEAVEFRAMEIALNTMKSSSEFMATQYRLDDIREPLVAQLKAGEITGDAFNKSWGEQTAEIFEQRAPMIEQIENDSRIYAADEMGADLSKMYPDLVTEEKPEVVAKNDATATDTNIPYVQDLNGGSLTFAVASVENGQPIMDFDEGSVVFENGNDVQNVFGNVSSPDVTHVAMVNPFIDNEDKIDLIDPDNSANNNLADMTA